MRASLAALGFALASSAIAQQPDNGPPRMPMKPDYAKALDISPEKAAQVDAVMEREREQMRKVHEGTRAELAKILTPEQLAKLEQYMPRGPRGPMGPGERRPMQQGSGRGNAPPRY